MSELCNFAGKLNNHNLASLFLRLAVGAVFINAGWMKVTDMEMVVGFFGQIGFPAFLAYFVSYAELVGGLLLVAGFLTRYASVVLAVIMLVACFVLSSKGFSLANGGYEYPFVLMFASLALVTLGSGKYSLEALCCTKCKK